MGAKLALRESFSTSRFWADVRATGATTALVIAATVSYLPSQPTSADDADHTRRNVFIAPIPAHADAFAERFGVRLCTVFNMTELSCPIVSGWGLGPNGGCGRVRPGAQCRIVDSDDREAPPRGSRRAEVQAGKNHVDAGAAFHSGIATGKLATTGFEAAAPATRALGET